MIFPNRRLIVLCVSAAVITACGTACAYDDGLGSYKKAEGKYTVTYYPPEADVIDLIQKINMRPADKILAGGPLASGASPEDELSQALDALFLQVSDILDMHLYSMKINIKICRDSSGMKELYRQMFNADLAGKQSFYVYMGNTIYTSLESFKREVVGHEMSHAVICHYFAVPAPVKVQEVLSMYVEYNLRNTGN